MIRLPPAVVVAVGVFVLYTSNLDLVPLAVVVCLVVQRLCIFVCWTAWCCRGVRRSGKGWLRERGDGKCVLSCLVLSCLGVVMWGWVGAVSAVWGYEGLVCQINTTAVPVNCRAGQHSPRRSSRVATSPFSRGGVGICMPPILSLLSLPRCL